MPGNRPITRTHRIVRITVALLSATAASIVAASPALAVPPAHIIDLGTLPGDFGSSANAINANGDVVGVSFDTTGHAHAFIFQAGSMVALGALPGDDNSFATAINSAGEAVGDSFSGSSLDHGHAVLFANGAVTDLGTLDGGAGCNRSLATGINDSGQIVGESSPVTTVFDCGLAVEAFISSNGAMTDLGHLPGDNASVAAGINNFGQAVGTSIFCATITGPCATHAVLFANGTVTDIGSLPGTAGECDAAAINDAGQIAGSCAGHAFLFSNGTMTDLGSPTPEGTSAFSISPSGQVVGWQGRGGPGTVLVPWFWSPSAGMIDLRTLAKKKSDWVLSTASGINGSGQIVGGGNHNNLPRAYVLTLPNKFM